MVSTITQRIGGAVAGVPVNTGAGGIISTSNVAGINTVTADGYPTISAYFPRMIFIVRPFAANTGPTTLNIDAVGALPWRTPAGGEHANGDLSPTQAYMVQLNEAMTEFRTLGPF